VPNKGNFQVAIFKKSSLLGTVLMGPNSSGKNQRKKKQVDWEKLKLEVKIRDLLSSYSEEDDVDKEYEKALK
jgi:hypothetical protein